MSECRDYTLDGVEIAGPQDSVRRIRAAVNFCTGITIPENVTAGELVEALGCAAAQLEADHDSEVAAEMFGGEPDPVRAMNINRHDVADMVRNLLTAFKGDSHG